MTTANAEGYKTLSTKYATVYLFDSTMILMIIIIIFIKVQNMDMEMPY